MPLLRVSASDVTATVKASAQVNAAIGGASSRGGNSAPPPAGGRSAASAVVTQSAVAKSGSGTFSLLRSIVTGPIARRITLSARIPVTPFIEFFASDLSGLTVYGGVNFNGLFRSLNGGTTWSKVLSFGGTTTRPSCSSDGTRVITTSGSSTGSIFTSIDGGATFQTSLTGVGGSDNAWGACAVSADGSTFFAAKQENLWISTDGGANWTLKLSINAIYSIACSTDGSIVYLGTPNGELRKSINRGNTWTQTPSTGISPNANIHCSSDGLIVLSASVADGRVTNNVAISRNGGVTYTQSRIPRQYGGRTLHMSRDGSIMAISTDPKGVFVSVDSGITFNELSIPQAASSTNASVVTPDGSKLIVYDSPSILIGTIA
jgi:hypothetical protein